MKKLVCDVCDKELDEQYECYKVEIKSPNRYQKEEMDLCKRHYKAFKKIFKFLRKENKNE